MASLPQRWFPIAIASLAPLLGAATCQAPGAKFFPDTGVLRVAGTPNADTIVISRTPGGEILVNGGLMPIQGGVPTVGNTVLVEVHGQPGNDHLEMDLGNGALPDASLFGDGDDDVLIGGPGADRLNGGTGDDEAYGRGGDDEIFLGAGNDLAAGGDGDDALVLGAGDDVVEWSPGDDDDVVDGQGGFDRLVFHGANVSENLDVSALGSHVRLFRDVASVTLDLVGIEAIDWEARGGSDVVAVRDLAGTDLVELDADLGVTPGGAADGASDRLVVEGTAFDDVVLVVGDASGAAVLGLAVQLNVFGADPSTDQIQIHTLAGDDTVDASGLATPAIGLLAHGGDDHDVLIGGDGNDVLLGGDGDDVLLGGPGIDVLDGGAGDNVVIQ